MQISFNNYINTVSQVKKTNETSSYQKNEKVDYSNYSADDIRKISYEEAKANYEDIQKRINELEDTKDGEKTALMFQYAKINMSDNDNLNKAMYETLGNIENPAKTMWMQLEMQINLQDFYAGKPTEASFVISNDDIHVSTELTRAQLNSIDIDAFISTMLDKFSQDLSETNGTVKEQYQNIINGYKLFQQNYKDVEKEPFYA